MSSIEKSAFKMEVRSLKQSWTNKPTVHNDYRCHFTFVGGHDEK